MASRLTFGMVWVNVHHRLDPAQFRAAGAALASVVLYSFGNGANDGKVPQARLTLGTDGVLYGTTLSGGPAITKMRAKVTPLQRQLAAESVKRVIGMLTAPIVSVPWVASLKVRVIVVGELTLCAE